MRIGLAERSGRGVDRIYEGSLLYGRQLPDYTGSSATSVKLFIPRGLPDENFVRMLSEEQQRTGVPLSLSSLLILNALKWGRRMSVGDIQQATHLLESKVRAAAERMVEAGLLETSGNGRNRAYIISSHMYQNKINYVRQTGIEKLRYKVSRTLSDAFRSRIFLYSLAFSLEMLT